MFDLLIDLEVKGKKEHRERMVDALMENSPRDGEMIDLLVLAKNTALSTICTSLRRGGETKAQRSARLVSMRIC